MSSYITLHSCQFFHKGQQQQSSYGETAKKLKSQIWNSVVTIVLIEGKQLLPMDDNGLSDPYVKFRLGNEKCRSKVKSKTLEPRWLEEFQLHMFDDYSKQLEITVWDKDVTGDDFMGRAVIDLNTLESERTHKVVQPLEDGAGVITLLITVTGSAGRETISDLSNYTPIPYERDAIVQKYGLIKSFRNMPDIGWLQVKVIKAEGLASADFGGKSDPYCVLELVNDYLQTQTEYKTLNPEWNKVFTFNVKDIHSVLEVTVYDEDRDMKKEFLGKVAIPLLKICKGERKIFALKDRKLQKRTKGTIHLELDIVYNHFKAAIRTVNPREEKYMQPEPKMKISLLKRNVARMASIVTAVRDTAQFVQSCFTWESKMRSALAFLSFLVIVWNFELYMLPLTLLLILLWNYFMHQVAISLSKDTEYTQTTTAVVEEEDEDEEKDK
ncbi:multiple C2 and transmembrane domain-containing protein 1-like, partial [Lingula anatina]|uniref:Multiple C2 and transmembrane domain-containing protein 1-like n=1 Tax=Lingula anatina TaxID=7574 RepID=A0A1S3J672_LINAN